MTFSRKNAFHFFEDAKSPDILKKISNETCFKRKINKFLPPKYCKRFMPSTYLHGITGPVSLAPAETMRE